MTAKERIREVFRVSVSLLFILGAIYLLRDKWKSAFQLLREIDLRIFGLACLLNLVINILVVVRLLKVLRIQNILVSFPRALYFSCVGLFFNLFLPSSIGGDVVKAYYLSRDSGVKMRTISSVLIDRMLGLGAVISVAIFTLPFFVRIYADKRLIVAVLLISFAFGLSVLFLLNRPLARRFKFLIRLIPSELGKRKVSEFYHLVSDCRHHLPKLSFCYGLSLVIQIIFIGIGFLVAKSIHIHIPFVVFMLVFPVSAIISMFPSLGGLGVREASMIYFLSAYASPEGATAYAVAFDILIYGFGFFCGILYLLLGGQMKMKSLGHAHST